MLQTIAAVVLSLFVLEGIGWAGACEDKCRNGAFDANGAFWAARNNANTTITVFKDGQQFGSQPGGTTPAMPALADFGGSVFIAVKGTDSPPGVWVNRWTGSSWTGWSLVNNGRTINSPDMTVFGSPTNTLFLAVAGTDNNMYRNRFFSNWLGWQVLPGYVTDAQTCADPFQIRIGGTGSDGRCWVNTSTDGANWSGFTPGQPCP